MNWDAKPEHEKRAVKTFSWATFTSVLVTISIIIGIWQGAARGMFVEAIAQEAAEKASNGLDRRISDTVKSQVEPIERKVNASNAGLKAIIIGNIAGLEADVDRLKYLSDYRREEWNADRQRELFEKSRALETQRQALKDILEAERPQR